MGDRELGLAGAGRADAEHQLMALQRADIGVLRGRAGPRRTLAQVDFSKRSGRAWRSNSNSEPCAIGRGSRLRRRRAPARRPALDARRAFEHAARRFAAVARAFDRHLITARLGDDAEPAFDQRKILPVLPEQRGGEAVVVEVEARWVSGGVCLSRSLRLGASEGESDAFLARVQAPSGHVDEWHRRRRRCAAARCAASRRTSCSVPGCRSSTGSTLPIMSGGAITCTGCR